MARISGMIFGLALLVVISSLNSPASAWDSDDDDDHRKYRPRPIGPVIPHPVHRPPIYVPPRFVEQPRYYQGGYSVPQYQYQHQPIAPTPVAPPPLPPEDLFGQNYAQPNYPNYPQAVQPVLPQDRPGQFVAAGVPLYPHVRVKGQDEVPRFAVHQIIAVKSPDPFRFPGCVYVQICVPPVPCRNVKVKDNGARIDLDYGDFEVEITSSRGLITVEYDD